MNASRNRAGILALAIAALAATGARGDERVLRLDGTSSRAVVPAGSAAELEVRVRLEGAWHVNAAKPADPMLIPTALTLEPVAGVSFGAPVYPEPKSRRFEFWDEPLLVYDGEIVIRVPLLVDATAEPGTRTVAGKLRYQACDESRCLAPRTEPVAIRLEIGAAGTEPALGEGSGGASGGTAPGDATGAGGASAPGTAAAGSAAAVGSAAAAPAAETGAGVSAEFSERMARRATDLFAGGSPAVALGLIFVVGLLLSFTPCVYPVIPITLGYFASQSGQRHGRTLGLALVYLLSMALMYAGLGAVAAVSGRAFGSALASPWVLVFEAVVMFALALSMFGVWEIGIPGFLATRLASSHTGWAGAAFMGLTVGIVAAPCIGPAIVALFTFVAGLGSLGLGVSIFFVFALGLGFPFLLLALGVQKLPRSGEWMVWVRHLFGFVLLGMVLYFLRPVLGDPLLAYGLPVLALAAAVFLGFLDPVGQTTRFRRVKAVTGVVLVLFAAASFAALRPGGMAEERIEWRAYEPAAFARALEQGTPVLVDFTAEWCVNCKELERFTFTDAHVGRAAERFVAFRADGTTGGDPDIQALEKRYRVSGYPTVLLIDSTGSEVAELRVVGFVPAEEFRRRLERVN